MNDPPWPLFFEINLIQRRALLERTVFVTIEEDGRSHWVDHSGRLTRRRGFGGIEFGPGGNVLHTRGGRSLSAAEEEAEKREFTVMVQLQPDEFEPILEIIDRNGKPEASDWSAADFDCCYRLLEAVYWQHVNRFMHEPFDPGDAF